MASIIGVETLQHTNGTTAATVTSSGKLGVATLAHTNGTTAATIDTAGRILTPTRPAFHLRRNASMSGSGEVTYTHTEFNIGGHANQNTGVFTAPIDGIYQFSFQCMGPSTSTALDVFAKINGTISSARWSMRPNSVNANETFSSLAASTVLLELNANDTLVMNATVALYSDTNSWIRFSGHLIG